MEHAKKTTFFSATEDRGKNLLSVTSVLSVAKKYPAGKWQNFTG
jgi:hypothetical protein